MHSEISIFPLRGNKRNIKNYARAIAEMNWRSSNAYAMAYNLHNEVVWCVCAGDVDCIKDIEFSDAVRVEIYDHGNCGNFKTEFVYVDSYKYLKCYLDALEKAKSEYNVDYNIIFNHLDNNH